MILSLNLEEKKTMETVNAEIRVDKYVSETGLIYIHNSVSELKYCFYIKSVHLRKLETLTHLHILIKLIFIPK